MPLSNLAVEEAHIWIVNLKDNAKFHDALIQLLSNDECERAMRLIMPLHGQRFVIARACLRLLLANYLNVLPQHLTFTYNNFGKPSLVKRSEFLDIHFNLSHSDEIMVVGFTLNRLIGVDVEKIRLGFNVEQIAKRYFSSNEYQDFINSDIGQQLAVFFEIWSRKEAVAKALGFGLSMNVTEFSVSQELRQFINIVIERHQINSQWYIESFTPNADYVAAVAVEGQVSTTKFYELTPTMLASFI